MGNLVMNPAWLDMYERDSYKRIWKLVISLAWNWTCIKETVARESRADKSVWGRRWNVCPGGLLDRDLGGRVKLSPVQKIRNTSEGSPGRCAEARVDELDLGKRGRCVLLGNLKRGSWRAGQYMDMPGRCAESRVDELVWGRRGMVLSAGFGSKYGGGREQISGGGGLRLRE